MNVSKQTFITKFTEEIQQGNAAIFAGAGLSMPAGFVNWKQLLHPLAEEIGLNIEKETDLTAVAQYYKNSKNNRSEINKAIFDNFTLQKTPLANHNILARLPITTFWTINYDELIEMALEKAGKIVDVKHTSNQLAISKKNRQAIVYKMHGDCHQPENAIILKEDYEIYSQKHKAFLTALAGDLVSKTFLFVGLSFTDPNLDYILSRIRLTYEENQRTHYAIIKKNMESDFDNQEEYHYEKGKQELFIRDLQRYNIQAVLIDNYSEITEILSAIEKKINSNKVFISGSATEYGEVDSISAQQFISSLSKELIKQQKKIISGFGLGVGSYVISGALEEIYMQQSQAEDSLILRPFPQSTSGNMQLPELWEQYRRDMLQRAGIAIFIFGNKEDAKTGETILANGMYQEFEIAKEFGALIIPVGATGYMAQQIWQEVNANFESYYPNANDNLKCLFQKLNNSTVDDELVETIIQFISELVK